MENFIIMILEVILNSHHLKIFKKHIMKLKIILFNLNLKVKEKTLQLHGWMKIQQE